MRRASLHATWAPNQSRSGATGTHYARGFSRKHSNDKVNGPLAAKVRVWSSSVGTPLCDAMPFSHTSVTRLVRKPLACLNHEHAVEAWPLPLLCLQGRFGRSPVRIRTVRRRSPLARRGSSIRSKPQATADAGRRVAHEIVDPDACVHPVPGAGLRTLERERIQPTQVAERDHRR